MSLFQSSSSPKTGCKGRSQTDIIRSALDVSILIQPEDQMQAVPSGATIMTRPYMFQSSSSPKTGCKGRSQTDIIRSALDVSILIQPEDQMQAVPSGATIMTRPYMFQSSSSPKTGCKITVGIVDSGVTYAFQSSSSLKTGCKSDGFGGNGIGDVFQSSSSPKTGCKGWYWGRCCRI